MIPINSNKLTLESLESAFVSAKKSSGKTKICITQEGFKALDAKEMRQLDYYLPLNKKIIGEFVGLHKDEPGVYELVDKVSGMFGIFPKDKAIKFPDETVKRPTKKANKEEKSSNKHLIHLLAEVKELKNIVVGSQSQINNLIKHAIEKLQHYKTESDAHKHEIDKKLLGELKAAQVKLLEAQKRLSDVFSPSHYHEHCSRNRAEHLLKNEPEGSYLIRHGVESGNFILSCVEQGQVVHKKIVIYSDGKCNSSERYKGADFDVYLSKIIPEPKPKPYVYVPHDH